MRIPGMNRRNLLTLAAGAATSFSILKPASAVPEVDLGSLSRVPGLDVQRGMTLVRATSTTNPAPVKQLMSRHDGGLDDPD